MDLKQIQAVCKNIEKKSGKGSIFLSGSSKNLQIPRWSTRVEDLDTLLGGGMPKGRIIELYGPESSGKTSLALYLHSLHQVSVYDPIEGTYDEERARAMGVKPRQMIVCRSNYGEEALNAVIDFAKAGTPLITIDSVPACQPKEDADKVEKDTANEFRIGGVARLFSRTLPSVERIIEETSSTVLLINQVRDKMNAMPFSEKEDSPGGRAIKFYSSIRLKTARRDWIEIPNKNPAISAKMEKIGIIMKLKVTKSKVGIPFGEIELPLFFDRGPVSYDDIAEIKAEITRKRKKEFNV